MRTILRRLRGALGLAVTWGVLGFGLGALIEIADPNGQYADIWPMVIAVPCFVGGLAFSLVLGVAARGRRFEDLALGRFTAWGATSGLLLGLVPMLVRRLAEPAPFGLVNLVVLAVTTSVCSGLAAGTLLIARRAESASDRLQSPDQPRQLAE